MRAFIALFALLFAGLAQAQVSPLQSPAQPASINAQVFVPAVNLDFSQRLYTVNGAYGSDEAAIPGVSISSLGAGTYLSSPDASGVLHAFTGAQIIRTNLGAEIWEARTNLVEYGNDLTNAYWAKSAATASLVSDPTMGIVSRLNNDSQNSIAVASRTTVVTSTGAPAVRYALVKSDGAASVALRSAVATAADYGGVALTFGTGGVGALGTATSVGATPLAGGWWLLWFVMPTTADGSSRAVTVRLHNSTLDPIGSGVLVKAVGAEVASFFAGAIESNGAAVTRNAAAPVITGLGAHLAAPYVVFAEADLNAVDTIDQTIFTLSAGGSTGNRMVVNRSSAAALIVFPVAGGVTGTGASRNGATGSRRVKIALRVRATSYKLSTNLGSSGETSFTAPAMDSVHFGTRQNGTLPLNGREARVVIIPGDMTDAQLDALTAP